MHNMNICILKLTFNHVSLGGEDRIWGDWCSIWEGHCEIPGAHTQGAHLLILYFCEPPSAQACEERSL